MRRSPSPLDLNSVTLGLRFLAKLPCHVRNPVPLETAERVLQRRFRDREQTFFDLVCKAVYRYPASPYALLLRWAGCERGDLQDMIRKEGLEKSLRTLLQSGVYLTVDEFKGKKTVCRGSFSLSVSPDQLRNPLASFNVLGRTGGSRSDKTPVLIDLGFIQACSVNTALFLMARGGGEWRKAIWEVSGAGARFRLLKFAGFGDPPVRYFTPLKLSHPQLHPIFNWSERAMRWTSALAGASLPKPQYAPVEDPSPILDWLRELFRKKQEGHLITMASAAVRLSKAALDAGMNLNGLHFTLGAEPITNRRLEVIRSSGAEALPRYGSMECGPVGYGCLRPCAPDDVHLLHDLHGLLQAGAAGQDLNVPSDALFVTSLHSLSPFVLINVSMGDRGVIKQRSCGCQLEHFGWESHISNISSFEKLTAGGVTFMDSDIIRILEEVLPDHFGGTATDYQLVEEEQKDGRPVLKLLVHPRVGALDIAAVRERLLRSVGSKTIIDKAMELSWREEDMVQVVREPPQLTSSGKILHLHAAHTKSAGAPG